MLTTLPMDIFCLPPHSFGDFEDFLTRELARGQNVLDGEYMLPSGTSLPLGVMISKLRRSQMVSDVMMVSVCECGFVCLVSGAGCKAGTEHVSEGVCG